ncbi:MAG TPA: SPFH domain-containing protein [Thermoplasmata archaeon]|jgi:flotillin
MALFAEAWVMYLLIVIIVLIVLAVLASLYTIVPADYADVVIQKGKMRVFSPHREYNPAGRSAYFRIPSWFFIFGLGMTVHRIPLRILAIDVPNFLSFDKDRARFLCDIIAYIAVKDPVEAAKRFGGDLNELSAQINKIVQATTRDVCTKSTVKEIINDRAMIIRMIDQPLKETITHWGIDLKDLELVDFKDPTVAEYGEKEPPHVIRDISSIIETQIHSEARQKNAEQIKGARLKEAEADETASIREIQRLEEVAKRAQVKDKMVAEQERLARLQQLEVTRVEQVRNAEIQKEKNLVVAEQDRAVEDIRKQRKLLEGQGDNLMLTEKAKGEAAIIREQLLAEAEGKMKLQEALTRFDDIAIRALTAEKMIEMNRAIGVEGAKALASGDLKVFAGGSPETQAGFDLGRMLQAIGVSSQGGMEAILNRLARPNDLGFRDFGELVKGYKVTPSSDTPVREAKAKKTE